MSVGLPWIFLGQMLILIGLMADVEPLCSLSWLMLLPRTMADLIANFWADAIAHIFEVVIFHLFGRYCAYQHLNISGHSVTIDNFSILGREDQNLTRLIKEALYIRVNNPSLNKNVGRYHLPHIWHEVLLNISELKLK